MKFTASQLKAINHPIENLQLIACAGSGKTEVVARRIAYLLNPKNKGALLPRNIVAFTFTEKAAAELKDRILSRVKEAHGDIHGLVEMYVGTIHAFCLDLLMTEVPEYLKYGVLNEVQQILFVNRHSRQSGLTQSTDLKGTSLRRYVDTSRYVTALSVLREDDRVEAKLKNCSCSMDLRPITSFCRSIGISIIRQFLKMPSTSSVTIRNCAGESLSG